MLTEEQAKEKTCHKFIPAAFLQRDRRTPFSIACLGSECMAWRQINMAFHDQTPRGYCGLAGDPHPAFRVYQGDKI